METIKAEPCLMWECPACRIINYVEIKEFKGEKHEKDYTIQWCSECDTQTKVEKE